MSREDDELWEEQESMKGKITPEQKEAAAARQREKQHAKRTARKQAAHGVVQRQMQVELDVEEKARQRADREQGLAEEEEDDDDDDDVDVKEMTGESSMMAIRTAETNNGLKVNRMVMSQIEGMHMLMRLLNVLLVWCVVCGVCHPRATCVCCCAVDSAPQFIDEMGRLSYKPEKLSAKQQLRHKQRNRNTGGQAKVVSQHMQTSASRRA